MDKDKRITEVELEVANLKLEAENQRLREAQKRVAALYNSLECADEQGDDEMCGVIRHQLDRAIEDMAALLDGGE
jgi:hypothetical protein